MSTLFNCKKKKRFGKPGDGGYHICMDGVFDVRKNDCLVYSFGINNEWSFDEDIRNTLGCSVYSFDPSMNMPNHTHMDGVYFYNLGVWGHNTQDRRGWELRNLQTIIHMLNHTSKKIDFMKFDVEGAEWSIIEHIVRSGVHSQIKQMAFEVHTPRRRKLMRPMTVNDYGEIFNGFCGLSRVGFRKYSTLLHPDRCCTGYDVLMPAAVAKTEKDLCCYEVFFVNENFID